MTNNNITFKVFKKFPEIETRVSVKSFGSMRQKNGEICQENVENFFNSFNTDPKKAVFMEQTHGNNLSFVNSSKRKILKGSDGLLTREKDVFLCITTADCLPIVLYDPDSKLTGVIHAGYKGIMKGILEKTIKKFEDFGANVTNILVGVGPSIEESCYNVSPRMINMYKKRFKDLKNFYTRKKGEYFLNLRDVSLKILISNGVRKENIETLKICTKCSPEVFFSYRNKDYFDRFITMIGRV